MDIRTYLDEKKKIVDAALEKYCPKAMEFPPTLHQAIRYSVFAGGKRIRPILSMAAFDAVGGKGDGILPFACALEMIHTYSLIHDDLPAIDDDDFRRGRPTCHKAFGEAMAILAGDALLTEAFQLMTNCFIQSTPAGGEKLMLDLVNKVAQAAGISGMVGGQVVDIESEGQDVDLATLQYIHTHKTGAMILASVQIGARLGGAEGEILKPYTHYGERIGLAFQIADDILDVEGKPELLGKSTGADLSKRKVTYPALLGIEESKRRARELIDLAIDALSPIGEQAEPLREIAQFIIARDY
ncbi:MAG: polyprenyl synthetase family protein [Desulfobacterales bacterium]|nr:polyprenyl synthetase family protein [Desulfobacterales bacterium]